MGSWGILRLTGAKVQLEQGLGPDPGGKAEVLNPWLLTDMPVGGT